MIRWLLDHNPHRRPSAQALLQSEYIPPKMEDKELLEVGLVVWVRMFLEACIYWRCISWGWDGDGSIGGTSHVVGVEIYLSGVHLM